MLTRILSILPSLKLLSEMKNNSDGTATRPNFPGAQGTSACLFFFFFFCHMQKQYLRKLKAEWAMNVGVNVANAFP